MTYRAFLVQTPLDSWSDPIFDAGGQERGAVPCGKARAHAKTSRLLGLPHLGLALGLLALLASEVKADITVNGIGLYDGAKCADRRDPVYRQQRSLGLWRRPDGRQLDIPERVFHPSVLHRVDAREGRGRELRAQPLVSPSFSTLPLNYSSGRLATTASACPMGMATGPSRDLQ